MFRKEFNEHLKPEQNNAKKLDEVYEALFRLEDTNKNIGPGLIQIVHRLDGQINKLVEQNRRQHTFVGGMLFAFTSVWLFITDWGAKAMSLLHKLGGH